MEGVLEKDIVERKGERFVFLFQKMTEWEWYKGEQHHFKIFMHLVVMAQWKDGKFRGISVKRGERLTSRRKISEETGVSEQRVRTILRDLELTHEITIRTFQKYSIISITNYDYYQCGSRKNNDGQPTKQPTKQPTNQPASNPQVTHTQPTSNPLYNKDNKENKIQKDNKKQEKAAAFLEQAKSILDLWNLMAQRNGLQLIDHELLDKLLIKSLAGSTKKLITSENWTDYFATIEQSDFLMGRKSNSDFVVSFAWAIKIDNINKVQRGEYSTKKKTFTASRITSVADKYDSLLSEIATENKIIPIQSEGLND
jgi:hypothetical protein